MTHPGKRATAEKVSEGIDLSGKHAVVTGANTGIGKETARVLALRGAQVTMACRDLEKAHLARDDILANGRGKIAEDQLLILQLDMNSLAGVHNFADEIIADGKNIDLLINNAGVMIDFERRTADGFEAQLGINHLAHFLLTNLLLPQLTAAGSSRVVCVASAAMAWASQTAALEDMNWEDRPVKGMRAYGDSKLMNLMFARELSRRHEDDGIVAHALHPGVITTELGRDQGALFRIFGLVVLPFMKNVAQGASTSVYAATAPEYGQRGGCYFADNREAKHHHKLAANDAACALLWERSLALTGLA
jgi:NAD(P)-dependent dehydrogenase (short-subunit alcohol dehydrogenase family)